MMFHMISIKKLWSRVTYEIIVYFLEMDQFIEPLNNKSFHVFSKNTVADIFMARKSGEILIACNVAKLIT